MIQSDNSIHCLAATSTYRYNPAHIRFIVSSVISW